MLTIQLPNGKTAEISVNGNLYLRTPKRTYVVKKDNEKTGSITTHIQIDRYQKVFAQESTSTRDYYQEFIRILGELESACGPTKCDSMSEPDIEYLNDAW